MLSKLSQKWKFQLDMDHMIKNQRWSGPRPILNLGSVPEVLLKYQPDTVLQWGYTFADTFRVYTYFTLHQRPHLWFGRTLNVDSHEVLAKQDFSMIDLLDLA